MSCGYDCALEVSITHVNLVFDVWENNAIFTRQSEDDTLDPTSDLNSVSFNMIFRKKLLSGSNPTGRSQLHPMPVTIHMGPQAQAQAPRQAPTSDQSSIAIASESVSL